ncbi:hypothetical protein Taro_040569 [Colocasia esculenta]|uniref:Uncharacterized protein n=1 Tax=Colocasia esculenta TaxID=4460 RepID=A0A843WTE7_COLES|nr:hypothetical protein [Colocasia esculenta]
MASFEKATFGPPAKQSRKLYSTDERVAAAIPGDVGLEACVLTWFWRVEAVRSVENTDRASFCEFFLLKLGVHRIEDLSWFLCEHRSTWLMSEKATGRAVVFRSRALALSRSGVAIAACRAVAFLTRQWPSSRSSVLISVTSETLKG